VWGGVTSRPRVVPMPVLVMAMGQGGEFQADPADLPMVHLFFGHQRVELAGQVWSSDRVNRSTGRQFRVRAPSSAVACLGIVDATPLHGLGTDRVRAYPLP